MGRCRTIRNRATHALGTNCFSTDLFSTTGSMQNAEQWVCVNIFDDVFIQKNIMFGPSVGRTWLKKTKNVTPRRRVILRVFPRKFFCLEAPEGRFTSNTRDRLGLRVQKYESTYVQEHPAHKNVAQDAGLIGQGGYFGRRACFWKNAIKTPGGVA